MARTKIETGSGMTLNELVPLYGEKNTACNALKKEVADLNSNLKKVIKAFDKQNEDIIIDGWKCKLTVTEDSVLNEARLIEFAKQHNIDIIRQKEYIDFDALESLIYHGEIAKEVLIEMDSCKDDTTKETLRINKVKE